MSETVHGDVKKRGRGRKVTIEPPRLALTPVEAAASLGCSRDFLDDYVLPELRVIRRGKLVLVPVDELRRWLDREAALTLRSQQR